MRYVAFLRGMNVGGHRLTNVELCSHFETLGFRDVAAFLASGNVLFDAGRKTDVAGRIERGLRRALGYDVPTFLRTVDEVVAIATRNVFDPALVALRGKEQVLLLASEPAPAAAETVLDLATDDDRLELRGRELHWLPRAGVLDTGLDFKLVERTIGPTTTRTKKTIERLAAKHFAGRARAGAGPGRPAIISNMTLQETLTRLEALGDEKVRKRNAKNGAGDNQFGAKLGDIKKLAKKIKQDHELALDLWETGNVDARLLATLVVDTKRLSADQMDRMVRTGTFPQVADWLNAYVVKQHPDKETLRARWMADDDPMAARAGWNLTAARVVRSPEGLDLPALLDRIESEMAGAAPAAQWTMNAALAEIGIHHPAHRKRAIAIGEKLGVYRDYPTSKGCTSPFAPIWIDAMVKRQG